MRLRVIAEEVAARGDFSCKFRAFADKPANHKKCGPDAELVKQVKQPRRDGGIWTIIKR